jgi:dihydropteroate synthase
LAEVKQAGEKGTRYNPRIIRVEDQSDAQRILGELGSDKYGVSIMRPKMQHLVIAVENVQARATHIIKQVMLSKGGECATPREVFLKDREPVSVIIIGSLAQLKKAVKNLSLQPFGLSVLAEELKDLLALYEHRDEPRHLAAGEFELPLGGRTLVMGVLNVTPDSFSDGGVYSSVESARARAVEMSGQGADLVDIGGESTRPGAEPVSLEEEAERTIPVIEALEGELGCPISIDTCKAELAEMALEAGASLINDISGLRQDPDMIQLAAQRKVPVIVMHMQGTPRDMQHDPHYEDVVGDIARFLRERCGAAIEGGIEPENILVDPGIGFGKTVEDNLEIMRRLDEFRSLDFPLVLGTSRKSFIGEVTGRPTGERLMGTAATLAFAISRGVDVVRVHDVEQAALVVRMADAMAGKDRPREYQGG